MNDQPAQTPEERLAEARRRSAESAPNLSAGAEIEGVSDRLQTVIDAAERAAEAIRWDAEEQARNHLAEAQQKADRLTAERVGLVAQLTDDLIDHAAVVKAHSEQMVGALEEAISTVNTKLEEADKSGPGGIPGRPGIVPPQHPRPSSARPETTIETPPERIVEAGTGRGGAPVEAEIRRTTEVITDASTGQAGIERSADSPDSPDVPATASDMDAGSPDPNLPGAASAEPSREMLLRATQLAVAGGSRESIGQALLDEFGVEPTAALDRVLPESS